MTALRDVEAAVRDAYLIETQPKQQARDLARLGVTIGPVAHSRLPAHERRPWVVIVSRGSISRHHRFAHRDQAEQLHRLLQDRRDHERETELDHRDDRHHDRPEDTNAEDQL